MPERIEYQNLIPSERKVTKQELENHYNYYQGRNVIERLLASGTISKPEYDQIIKSLAEQFYPEILTLL